VKIELPGCTSRGSLVGCLPVIFRSKTVVSTSLPFFVSKMASAPYTVSEPLSACQ